MTPQEVQVYGQLFKAASHSYPDRVTGPEAVRFFARSGVPNEILSDVRRFIAKEQKKNNEGGMTSWHFCRFGKRLIETIWVT